MGCYSGDPPTHRAPTGLEAISLASADRVIKAPTGRVWLPGRQADRCVDRRSDLLHIVSWKETFLAMQPTFPPARRIFHQDLNYFIHVKAQLIHILAYVLVQCPAPRAMYPWLGLRPAHSWHRSLPYTSLPLHACHTLVRYI